MSNKVGSKRKSEKTDPQLHVRKRVAGGATGAMAGAVVAGPIGAVIGGVLGTAIGAAAEQPKQKPATGRGISKTPHGRGGLRRLGKAKSAKRRTATRKRSKAS